MDRVYMLLRNNQQTGPFTIGELLQQQLRSSDMIWIEGKSAAWTYLSELELIPFVKDSEIPQPKIELKTEDEIERKAEELRKRVLAPAPRTYFPQYVTEIETFTSPYKMTDDQIEFVDYRKEKKVKRNAVLGELTLTCIVIGLFMIGIYKGKSFLTMKKNVHESVATQLDSKDQHTAQSLKPVTEPVILPSDTVINRPDSLMLTQRATSKMTPVRKRVIDSSIESKPLNAITLNKEEKKQDSQSSSPASEETSVKKEPLTKREFVPAIPDVNNNITTGNEEKKGFLKGLFKKEEGTEYRYNSE